MPVRLAPESKQSSFGGGGETRNKWASWNFALRMNGASCNFALRMNGASCNSILRMIRGLFKKSGANIL